MGWPQGCTDLGTDELGGDTRGRGDGERVGLEGGERATRVVEKLEGLIASVDDGSNDR